MYSDVCACGDLCKYTDVHLTDVNVVMCAVTVNVVTCVVTDVNMVTGVYLTYMVTGVIGSAMVTIVILRGGTLQGQLDIDTFSSFLRLPCFSSQRAEGRYSTDRSFVTVEMNILKIELSLFSALM